MFVYLGLAPPLPLSGPLHLAGADKAQPPSPVRRQMKRELQPSLPRTTGSCATTATRSFWRSNAMTERASEATQYVAPSKLTRPMLRRQLVPTGTGTCRHDPSPSVSTLTASNGQPSPSPWHGTCTILYSPVAGWYAKLYAAAGSNATGVFGGGGTTIFSPVTGLTTTTSPWRRYRQSRPLHVPIMLTPEPAAPPRSFSSLPPVRRPSFN